MIFASQETDLRGSDLEAPPLNAVPRLVGGTTSWYLTLFTVHGCEKEKSTGMTAKGTGWAEKSLIFSPQVDASPR